ncbi:MAG: pimeloyl-ACP methyl ester carboxylesterase [Verrucomicrobiales bacterium]|jgi:pimeloyl-ACP methyl ester carboxylesterase
MGATPDGTVYEIAGPADAPPVVLIHGLGMTRATWDGHMPKLAERYRVVRYDLAGHGQTPPPNDVPDLTLFSEQCISLMGELDIEAAVIIGFSLGGMINRRIAIDYPERVNSLVILNSPHERGEEAQQLVEVRAAASADGGPAATIDASLERWFTATFRAEQPDFVAMIRNVVLDNDIDVYALNRWVLANGVIELVDPTPAITAPTLIMTCEHDSGSTPAMSHAIAAEIAGAETVIVPDRRHLGLLEDPDAFIDPILTFLRANVRQADPPYKTED